MLDLITFNSSGPLVALLGDGPCAGQELERALACPHRLASPGARLDPRGRWPVTPALERQEPTLAAALAGIDASGPMPAAVAQSLGLLDGVHPVEGLRAEGDALVARLVSGRDEAQVEAILGAVDDALVLSTERALDREADRFLTLARRRFGPARQAEAGPTSPRVGEGQLATAAGGGSGWGNFPPPQPGGAELLRVERDSDLATLLLDDPPRNEMTDLFFGQLAVAMRALRAGPAPAGLVIRGAARHFSSGADLEELGRRLSAERDSRVRLFLADNIRTFQNLAGLAFPSVAAVSGCCLGSGLELALACKHRFAADNAVLALPEAQYGLMPGCGGTVRLSRLLGRRRALELILSGRSVMASEAYDLGLVDAVLPRRELAAAAARMARQEAP